MAGHPHFPFLGIPTSVPMKRPHTYIENEREYSVLKTSSGKKRPDLASLTNEFAAQDKAAKEAEWFGHMMGAMDFRGTGTGGDGEAHGTNEPPEPSRKWKGGQQPPLRRPGLEMDTIVWGEGDGYMPSMSDGYVPSMSGMPGMPGMPGMHGMHGMQGMHGMLGMPFYSRAGSGVTHEFPCHMESKEMDYFCAFLMRIWSIIFVTRQTDFKR